MAEAGGEAHCGGQDNRMQGGARGLTGVRFMGVRLIGLRLMAER